MKDELTIGGIKDIHSCGKNALTQKQDFIYEGALIKESLEDETILSYLCVHKVELWDTGGKPRYWTVIFFTSSQHNFPELVSKVLIADKDRGGNWFVDFKKDNLKYIIFKDTILKYEIGNTRQKETVCDECRKRGISYEEMKWQE